jgi:hypothetical protein
MTQNEIRWREKYSSDGKPINNEKYRMVRAFLSKRRKIYTS